MSVEIERKFLVDHKVWREVKKPKGTHYRQGYLLNDAHRTIRIRVTGKQGYLTFKGATKGISRTEYEYKIPVTEGNELLKTFALSQLEKIRYRIRCGDKLWEVDEFLGDNEGLIMAEIELKHENEAFSKPAWIANEVSDDNRYFNSSLSTNPYKNWAG